MYESYLQGHTDAYVSLAHEYFVPLCILASGKQGGLIRSVLRERVHAERSGFISGACRAQDVVMYCCCGGVL